MLIGSRTRSSDPEKRMELTEHLGELRTRIIRSLWYLIVGAILAYQFFAPLYGVLYRPLQKEIQRQNAAIAHGAQQGLLVIPHALHNPPSQQEFNQLAAAVQWVADHPSSSPLMSIVFRNFHEPFLVRLQISIIYGFILVMPFVMRELAGFITPALTPEEKKPLNMLLPLSAVLLIFGILVAYFTMFYAMHWFLSYLADFPQPAVLMQDPNDYILFFVKMMAAFGVAFQLPVVLMGLAYGGVITSKGLIQNWRWGFVIAALGGLFTPSNDLPSMALMAFPLLLLYFGSIVLVRMVERTRAKTHPAPAP